MLLVFSGLWFLVKFVKEEIVIKEVFWSYKIIIDNNLVSIVGGKWIIYWKMGEDVVN